MFGGIRPPTPHPQKLIYAAVRFSEKKKIQIPDKNSEASDCFQKEPQGKYRGIQISEIRTLVAGEQRQTGPGAPLGLQMPTRCSHFCTQISHNPGTLNAHSF